MKVPRHFDCKAKSSRNGGGFYIVGDCSLVPHSK